MGPRVHGTTATVADRERDALSRELNEFLIELSVALHKFSMYPSGHPSLLPAASGVVGRATQLLADRPQIAFGVARRQLIIEGIATSASQPVLRRLAEELHRHHLGAVTFLRGISAEEVGEALRALSREPEQHGALGSASNDARTWPHLRLHPMTFGGLALVADAALTSEAGGAGGTRGAELWIGLARAAMAAEDDTAPTDTEPAAVARAIDEHPGADAYDQVVIGHLLQIARELRTTEGPAATALKHRTARLISALNPETLRRLVDMSGDLAQRRQFVLDATHGMAVDTVIDIVKAAADTSGQPISDGLVRMLSKLATHAEFGAGSSRQAADEALREQVGDLLNGWELADPNPDDYGKLLQRVATSANQHEATPSSGEHEHRADPLRMIQMSLEAGETGPMVTRAVENAVSQGQLPALVALVAQGPAETDDAAATLLRSLAHGKSLRTWFATAPIDFDALDHLLPHISVDGCRTLLDALGESDDRTTRRKLLDRLAALPHDLEPALLARLDDERWYVQRNMLVLLERRRRLPKKLSLARFATHPDVRVRHEAIRLQMRIPAEYEAAVRTALESGHSGLMQAGLAAIPQECPDALIDHVVAIAADRDADETMRAMAVRVLGRCPDRRALVTLMALVDGGRTLLGRQRLAPRSALVLAVLEALAADWQSNAHAAALLRLAASSSDPKIRAAAAMGKA
jgi:hypothetical protein